MQDFRELKVWQKAHELTLDVYRATAKFPREELYGITSQIRRCAASVAANLTEGRCRRSDREFGRFVAIALGSASETEYYLLLSRDLDFIDGARYEQLAQQAEEVKKMLTALHARLTGKGEEVFTAANRMEVRANGRRLKADG
jgi:four helix bundle protein